jgi:K+-transporting ATPase ATPase B chain
LFFTEPMNINLINPYQPHQPLSTLINPYQPHQPLSTLINLYQPSTTLLNRSSTMKDKSKKGLLQPELLRAALWQSLVKLDPRRMFRNPVMFTVEIGMAIMLVVTLLSIAPDADKSTLGHAAYNAVVFVLLLLTVLFANFAEAFAEARGKAQAESLRKTRKDTPAKKMDGNGNVTIVSSSTLRRGDMFVCETGDIIPTDGEITVGLATIDESAITGESAPVIREAGGDKSSVTGGTKVLSDRIVVQVTVQPGESFLDKMIALVEGASRQKTPNEIALTILLAGFTLVFVIVCVTLKPFADYAHTPISIAAYVSLFVCLIPTTIGGLLSAIGIAGMDRALRANVITKSGKAVETAGDLDVLLLDKTGTITIGNRKATRFYPAEGSSEKDFIRYAALSSLADETPEGKSIVELAGKEVTEGLSIEGARLIMFSAETRSSGVDLPDGVRIRKGAFDAIRRLVVKAGNELPQDMETRVADIAREGGTPLVVALNEQVVGVIELQDIIKPGIRERFERLRRMGVKTVMVTGDNPLTAKYIAHVAGVDDFIAEAKPEDKMQYIRAEQEQGKLVAMMGDGTNDAPALAQADVGVAMNSGTQAAKEAGNMVDLDNDPTKLIEIVEIGKQLLMTRGTLTTFSIANDVAKYFAIVPALFMAGIPALQHLNIMRLASPESAILSAVIFNALIIPALIPLALKGVAYKPVGASALLRRNLFIYGLGGVVVPFLGIKVIDLVVSMVF